MNQVFCSVRLKGVFKFRPYFASNSLKLSFKLFFLTDVGDYCEEQKRKAFD